MRAIAAAFAATGIYYGVMLAVRACQHVGSDEPCQAIGVSLIAATVTLVPIMMFILTMHYHPPKDR